MEGDKEMEETSAVKGVETPTTLSKCLPILCSLAGSTKCMPGVRVSTAEGLFCVLPLGQTELGVVWKQRGRDVAMEGEES